MGALALTIATSMVAGTMAVYTHADTLAGATNDTVSAKKFYINSTATDKINIKLAPGNEEFWDFQVTNHKEHIVTEVPMDLKLKVDLKMQRHCRILYARYIAWMVIRMSHWQVEQEQMAAQRLN